MEGGIYEGDEVVREDKYKGDINHEDSGQSPGGGDIGRGVDRCF